MADVAWDDRLNTGDSLVDAQHRELHQLVCELGSVAVDDHDRVTIEAMLYRVLRYAAIHFSDEEALMRRIGYPGIEHQRRLHTEFALEATAMATNFVVGTDAPTIDSIQEFMHDWLIHHVMEEDLLMAEYISADSS